MAAGNLEFGFWTLNGGHGCGKLIYSVGIFGMFLGADLANCFSISKLGIASNKPTKGYGEKCDEIR